MVQKVVKEDDYDIDLMEIYKVDDDSGIMIKDNIWNKPLGISHSFDACSD